MNSVTSKCVNFGDIPRHFVAMDRNVCVCVCVCVCVYMCVCGVWLCIRGYLFFVNAHAPPQYPRCFKATTHALAQPKSTHYHMWPHHGSGCEAT